MTEAELRAKIKDIESERSRLKGELNQYELQLDKIKYQAELADRNESIGKCYLSSNVMDCGKVRAFKILSIPEQGRRITHAICLILTQDGIDITLFGVWSYAKMQKLVTDPTLVVDTYVEIPQEEFENIVNVMVDRLVNTAKTGDDGYRSV